MGIGIMISCSGKVVFRTKPEAEKYAKKMRRRHDNVIFRAYRCARRHWHVGSQLT